MERKKRKLKKEHEAKGWERVRRKCKKKKKVMARGDERGKPR